jgi:hypothetical protein
MLSAPMHPLAGYLHERPGQMRVVSETCLYGVAAGAATVAFQLGMNWLDDRCPVCRLD